MTNSHMSLCMVSNRSGIIFNRFISLENSRDTLLHTGIYIIGRYVSLGGEEDLLYLDHLIFSDNSGLTILFAAIKSPQEKWIWSHGKSWEGQKNRSLRGGMRSTYTLHFILAKNTLNTSSIYFYDPKTLFKSFLHQYIHEIMLHGGVGRGRG